MFQGLGFTRLTRCTRGRSRIPGTGARCRDHSGADGQAFRGASLPGGSRPQRHVVDDGAARDCKAAPVRQCGGISTRRFLQRSSPIFDIVTGEPFKQSAELIGEPFKQSAELIGEPIKMKG